MKGLLFVSLLISGFSWSYDYPTEVTEEMFQHYKSLNDADTVLMKFKDSDEMLRAKLHQLIQINDSRKRFKVQPVELDILACRIANKICEEATENRYMGHWNLAGEKPYHRYGKYGGKDHIEENVYSEWYESNHEYQDISIDTQKKMMAVGHESFMKEKAPFDGHKKTIINGWHNYVGIGCAMNRKQFTYYEEFIDRYLDIESSLSEDGRTATVRFRIQDPKQFVFDQVSCTYDKIKPMSAEEINNSNSYRDFGDDHQLFFNDELENQEGWYTATFDLTKPGAYYVQVLIVPIDRSLERKNGLLYASGLVFFK